MRRRRRSHELANITMFGDVNELSISGHVEQRPVLGEDDDGVRVCEFVLTHTTTNPYGKRWERQRYNVAAYGELGEHYAANWQPDQTLLIDGRLEHQLCQTLAGPIPSISIVAHTIDSGLGPHPHTHDHQGDG